MGETLDTRGTLIKFHQCGETLNSPPAHRLRIHTWRRLIADGSTPAICRPPLDASSDDESLGWPKDSPIGESPLAVPGSSGSARRVHAIQFAVTLAQIPDEMPGRKFLARDAADQFEGRESAPLDMDVLAEPAE